MNPNDQRTVLPGTRSVSSAVARRTRRLRLVVEYLRSHERLAEPASASRDHQGPDLSMGYGVRS